MPISGCHDLPLATFNLPSRVFRHGCRRAECLERRWGGFFHTLSSGQHMPPQQALKTNGNSAPTKLKKQNAHQYSSRLSSGCERISQTKKIKTLVLPLPRRHAWLAAPAANTCSRNKPSKQTATAPPKTKNQNLLVPSLLRRHACLTTPVVKRPLPQRLPVQPQKNPPIPPNPSCCRSTGGCGWLAGPPANTCSRNNPQNKQQQRPPNQKIKAPRAAAPAAACVAGRSRGQHMLPQQPSKQTATASATKPQNNPPKQPPLVQSLPCV